MSCYKVSTMSCYKPVNYVPERFRVPAAKHVGELACSALLPRSCEPLGDGTGLRLRG